MQQELTGACVEQNKRTQTHGLALPTDCIIGLPMDVTGSEVNFEAK